ASKSLRPLSPEKKKPARSVMQRRYAAHSSRTRAGSPEVIDFDFATPGSSGSSAKSCRMLCVKFNEDLNSEVPLIAPKALNYRE
ncbi:unnamed protein product, partial [Symbiodinium pilosum]